MSIAGQMRQIAQTVADDAKAELLKALEAAEARIEALEARLGDGSPDETESAAKAPRRGRGASKVADAVPGAVADAAPAAVEADAG